MGNISLQSFHLLSEFAELVASTVLGYDRILVVGDFNFHVDILSNSSANEFLAIMESFNFTQHVSRVGLPILLLDVE